jgi:hypothetical protein
MEKMISMVGGDGEFQLPADGGDSRIHNQEVGALLVEAIKHMSLPEHGPLHIADLGCSTGRNSISYVNLIVKCITDRYNKAADETSGHVTTCMPEMLVFFIDLPANDFYNLIQLLASKAENDDDSIGVNGVEVRRANYFSTTMGGSFYNRLLPKESMHFVISTWAVQWMSQV